MTKKVKCGKCQKKCTGDALKANSKFYHVQCFTCRACDKPLSNIGFFDVDDNLYCPEDYHAKFGRECPVCRKFVEGEVIDCLGKTFHQHCFRCSRCCVAFSSNLKITETNSGEYLCQKCVAGHFSPSLSRPLSSDVSKMDSTVEIRSISPPILSSPTTCAACNELIHSGQVLLALDTQWHMWCFKCTVCQAVLQGEYMAKDGLPYCVRDYNSKFGVVCYECSEYIAGKVLQAGEYYFHPNCALCTRCGEHFAEQEEMYMQGDEIWHARCNDLRPLGALRTWPRSPKKGGVAYPKYTVDFGKHLAYMYLLPEQSVTRLKYPIGPHPPMTPQFHYPQGAPVKLRRSRISMCKTSLQKLAEVLAEQHPRPRSPKMDNEEPIEMSHYPGAHRPEPDKLPPIERDDFPAPPYPYAVEEIKRRLSSSDLEDEDVVDGLMSDETKIKKAEEELKKFENESSIAKIVANSLQEDGTKKVKSYLHWDPRSASRTPSAKRMPLFKCRYESPVNASPSRYLNRPRPWEYWEPGRAATATLPYISATGTGYGFAKRAATLPEGAAYYIEGIDVPDLSAIPSSGPVHAYRTLPGFYGEYETPRQYVGMGTMAGVPLPSIGPMPAVLRRSLPDMTKPAKIYSYSKIVTTNAELPPDLDRLHLERHLTKEEFEQVFNMTPLEFYKLPDWKRINLKRIAKLY